MRKEHQKNYDPRENLSDFNTIPQNFEIKAQNSAHIFNIRFEISKKSSNKENLKPNELFNTSDLEVLVIKAVLINKNEKIFNKNNEVIDVSEFYQDKYTLSELKNNSKGFEYFFDLITFKNSFIKSIQEKKYELLIVKDILLLNINIDNYSCIYKTIKLVIRPTINLKNQFCKNNFICNFNKDNNSSKELKLENIIIPISQRINPKIKSSDDSLVNNSLINKKSLLSQKTELKNQNNSINNYTNYNYKPNLKPIEKNDNIESLRVDKPKNSIINLYIETLVNNSEIIKDIKEENLISEAITINSNNIRYRLLYKASRDGDSANKFHNLCDEVNNIIILIKTKIGLRFGGFTSNKFRTTSHLKFDNKAFLFSLDNKKIYKIIPGEYAIYCYENTGPCFAKRSLYIPNKFFKKLGKTCLAGGPFQFKENYELNGGTEQFNVEEMEVFQIKFCN